MSAHVPFDHLPQDRERLLRFLHQGDFDTGDVAPVSAGRRAVRSGGGYAVPQADDAVGFYELLAVWSEYGPLAGSSVVPLAAF